MKRVIGPALAGIGVLIVGGCASAAPVSSTPPPSATAEASQSAPAVPGHATPQAAVAGVIHAEQASDLTRSCSYLEPSVQQDCRQAASIVSSPPPLTAQVQIGTAVISGPYALVEVTGRTCSSAHACESNSSPGTGMPASPQRFTAAYDRALAGSSHHLSPVPCVKVGSQWYVNENP
jgi:hypothetical protein